MQQTQSVSGSFGTPLVSFQLDSVSIQKKSDYDWGLQLAQYIESTVNGGSSSYFWVRNQRWKTNRNYANGKVNMSRFQDLLEFNGKVNHINLIWQCIHIVNRIVSGLVGRWMTKNEKISVTATDSLSTKEKKEQYERLEFFIENKRQLEKIESESGVKIIPTDTQLPADKDELNLWQAQFQRLPEEILYELGVNDVLGSCGWFDVLKEKMLHDSAVTGFVGTYTWMDSEGVIHVEWLKPENCFYSYSNFPDFRDTTWRGCMRTMKISELRKKYGKEFQPNNPHALSEEQLFDMARTAKEYQLYDNVTWITEWNVTFLRPYDEWNVDVLEFEVKTVDKESYTVVTTKKNKSTLIKKGAPVKKADNEEVIEDSKINIYRGVYARSTQTMLEWGLKKNMIRPQDPKETGNAEFSFSFFMVQNYDMTCLGIPEKIQEPADQMIIARLKIQQLVAKMRPAGTAVNWDAIQNIDYGLGDNNKPIDFKKMFDQTGDFYYKDKDAEGRPVGVPFTEIPNAGFLPQLEGLIKLYQFHYQVMKDELGEDPNLISQALQPRVTAGNVEASQQTAEHATDYYYNAYVQCMQDTSRKISCLLKESVTYGAEAYRNIVGNNDVEGRIFSTRIQMLPDAIAIQKFEMLMQQAIATNQDLVLFIDPFQMMRVAKEDVKLAEVLFRQGTKKMILHQQQVAQQNQEATFKAQIESAKTTEEEKRKTEDNKGEIDLEQKRIEGDTANKNAVISMVTGLLGKGIPVPANLQPLVNATVESLILPMLAQTEQQKQQIMQAMTQGQQQGETEQLPQEEVVEGQQPIQ
jgi:hypothetical protein